MKTLLHQDLGDGRWAQLSLAAQLGNIGSEVSRAHKARKMENKQRMNGAIDRMLELFDLTIEDPKNRGRLKEVCRAREVVCDYLLGANTYNSSDTDLDRYFLQFAVASKK